jgi:predicted DNA-binding transcriptional regulator AlpA
MSELKTQLRDWQGAADHLGVRVSWLRSQIKQKRGPQYLKPSPKSILFREEDLDAWKATWKVCASK